MILAKRKKTCSVPKLLKIFHLQYLCYRVIKTFYVPIMKVLTLPNEHVPAMSFEDVVLEVGNLGDIAKRTGQL